MGLLSENLGKYELLTGADVLIKRDLFKKAAAVKGFEYSPLGSELKKKNEISNQHWPRKRTISRIRQCLWIQ